MNALIVDDYKAHRLYLKNLVKENFDFIDRVDEAESVTSALQLLNQNDYDILFLDMELKDGIGFDILREMKDYVFAIVVSSHKEYAIEAFKHQVIDYILKPVNVSEFKNAVNRVFKMQTKTEFLKQGDQKAELIAPLQIVESDLMVNYKNTFVKIKKNDILFVKAQGKNSEIYMSDNKCYTSNKNLKEFELVMSSNLIRIHHSYLVNKTNIISFCRESSEVKLSGGVSVPVSVRKREELFRNFKVF